MKKFFIVLHEESRQWFDGFPYVLVNGNDMDDVLGRLRLHISSIQEVDDDIANAIATKTTYVHNV
jgi:hypothetical protein